MVKKGFRIDIVGCRPDPAITKALNGAVQNLGGEWRANELRNSRTSAEAIFDEKTTIEMIRVAIAQIFPDYQVDVLEDNSIM